MLLLISLIYLCFNVVVRIGYWVDMFIYYPSSISHASPLILIGGMFLYDVVVDMCVILGIFLAKR